MCRQLKIAAVTDVRATGASAEEAEQPATLEDQTPNQHHHHHHHHHHHRNHHRWYRYHLSATKYNYSVQQYFKSVWTGFFEQHRPKIKSAIKSSSTAK